MIARSVLILFTLGSCLMAEPVLRISKVATKHGKDTKAMIYAYTSRDGVEREEELIVENEAIVTEADLEEAAKVPNNQRFDEVCKVFLSSIEAGRDYGILNI